MKKNNKRRIVVAVSGGFDPIHVGHIRYFQAAKKLGDELVVIINNDNWLRKKKGIVFMPEKEREELVKNMTGVDRVLLTKHANEPMDMSVSNEILKIKPDIFANGGDVSQILEAEACDKVGCKLINSVGRGGKIQSSSWLLDKFSDEKNKNKKRIKKYRKKYQRLYE